MSDYQLWRVERDGKLIEFEQLPAGLDNEVARQTLIRRGGYPADIVIKHAGNFDGPSA
ncbi:hypothetical protein KTE13_18020 [Burkholderia multivorans]|uniref:hypothetical protein n=1 Tax=Burkholderia multivorans TaxID=87883 RepID=UPI001C213516|nr:hypothetical protein [Burkholderia multivorans]MBU9401636.1 hypothetical protein [Burkholderia multivorans]